MVAVQQNHPTYTYVKRGIYYFSRYVPSDLKAHYSSDRIVRSLKTSSSRQAERSARMLAAKLDSIWLNLRLKKQLEAVEDWMGVLDGDSSNSSLCTLSEARDLYLETKGAGRNKYFIQSTKRYVGYLIECLGDRPIDLYSSKDAAKYRDWLVAKGLSKASVQRTFSSAKAVFNFVIAEQGLDIRNPFNGVYLQPVDDAAKRKPVKGALLSQIKGECMAIDDDIRWLVALISDTGMRLAEAAGLMVKDIQLDAPIPFVKVTEHSHRSLKTKTSNRVIPLAGASLWAAKRIVSGTASGFCFPRYNQTTTTNANSASAAINKWLKSVSNQDIVVHGMRHGVRDRLRSAGAPTEIIDQIGGWSYQNIGQSYGDGYDLETTFQWIERMCEY